MNKTKIEWTDYSWNPVTGCKHGCWYCYANKLFTRFGRSFEPTFYPERLTELKKLKKPAKIFVCSVADLFAKWTPEEWRDAVLTEISKPEYNHLTFQLLTKNPGNIELEAKENIWIGTTITKQCELSSLTDLVKNYKGIKFVSFEPLLQEININHRSFFKIDWVIVGKLTGSKKIKLDKRWVEIIIKDCRHHNKPIFLKNNLNWHMKIQEYPYPLKLLEGNI
jgi:protein gp37